MKERISKTQPSVNRENSNYSANFSSPPKPFHTNASRFFNAKLSIIPLKCSEKKPAIRKINTYFSKLPKQEEFESWLKNYPDSNIGLICGAINNLVVIDCDDPTAIDTWLEVAYNSSSRDKLKDLVVVKTREDASKLHFYYAYPQSDKLQKYFKTKSFLFGQETKIRIDVRSDKGYVVAPYSYRKGIGYYSFYNKNMEEIFFKRSSLPELPADIIEKIEAYKQKLVSKKTKKHKKNPPQCINKKTPTPEWKARVTELTKIPYKHHTRDNNLFSLACSFVRFRIKPKYIEEILEYLIDNHVEQPAEDIYEKSNAKIKVKSAYKQIPPNASNNKPTKADKAIITGLFNNIAKKLGTKQIVISDRLLWIIHTKRKHELVNKYTGEVISSFKLTGVKSSGNPPRSSNASAKESLVLLGQLVEELIENGEISFYRSSLKEQAELFGMVVKFKDFDGNYYCWPINNKRFKEFIISKFYSKYNNPLFVTDDEFITVIEGVGVPHSKIVKQFKFRDFYDESNDCFYILLDSNKNVVVQINKDGWKLANDYDEVVFLDDTTKIPMGTKTSDASILKKYNINHPFEFLKILFPCFKYDKNAFILAVTWLLNASVPDMGQTYYYLLVTGNKGTGKTTLSKYLKSLIDNSRREMVQNTDEYEFHLIASKEKVLLLDNIDKIKKADSDLYCKVATGSTISARKHYSQNQLVDIYARNPIIFNGLNNPIYKDDLQSRTIRINLVSPKKFRIMNMSPIKFKRLKKEFAPYIRAAIYDCLATYLRCINDYTLEFEEDISRSQDLALLIKIVTNEIENFPFTFNEFVNAFKESQDSISIDILESDEIMQKLLDYLRERNEAVFKITTAGLRDELIEKFPDLKFNKYFTVDLLGKRISNNLEMLHKLGYDFKKTYVNEKVFGKKRRGWEIKNLNAADKDEEVKSENPHLTVLKKNKTQDNTVGEEFSISELVDTTPANEELANLI